MNNTHARMLVLIAVAGVAVLGSVRGARAQEWYGAATWQISVPYGDTKDFVESTSFGGMGLDFRKVVRENTTAGFMAGWNIFHERRTGTDVFGDVSVTGTQDRYINSFPIMVSVHRYFGEKRSLRPYVGLNAGGFIVLQEFAIGVYAVKDDTWDWGLAPEVGIVIPTQSGAGFLINARYNWSPTVQDLTGADADLTYWGINIGFVWEQY
jgi:outer membrane protein W